MSHLAQKAAELSDRKWEGIIAVAWAMKPVPLETLLRRAAATATAATARAVISDSESSSEDDLFFDAMYLDSDE